MYQVHVVEPATGQLRTICLYVGIGLDEIKMIINASFENCSTAVGLLDGNGINYPISMLANNPKIFHGQTLSIITAAGESVGLYGASRLASQDSEVSIPIADFSEMAFRILDKNGDGYVHKEEFIEVAGFAFKQFLNKNAGFAFSYSCLTPKELAVAASVECYHFHAIKTHEFVYNGRNASSSSPSFSDYNEDDPYYLSMEQFSKWFRAEGGSPIKRLMSLAMDSLARLPGASYDEYELQASIGVCVDREDGEEGGADGASTGEGSEEVAEHHTLKRTRSLLQLQIRSAYADERVRAFTKSCQFFLKFTGPAVTYLIDLINVSTRGLEGGRLDRAQFVKLFHVFLIQHDVTPTERDKGLTSVLDAIFNILLHQSRDEPAAGISGDFGGDLAMSDTRDEAAETVQVVDLCCLLSLLSPSDFVTTFKAVYDVFPIGEASCVHERILYTHLCQVARVIFFFSPGLREIARPGGVSDVAYAASIKLLRLVEPNRQYSELLTFEEYVELFAHSLKLLLDSLQISDGYFLLFLRRLVQETAVASSGAAGSVGSADSMATLRPVEDDSDEEDDNEVDDVDDDGDDAGQRQRGISDGDDDEQEEDDDDDDGDYDGSGGGGDDDTSDPLAKEFAAISYDDEDNALELEYDSEAAGAQIVPEGVVLEETQIRADSIAYAGAAVSVSSARRTLGLTRLSSGKVCMWIESIAEFGMVSRGAYREGLAATIQECTGAGNASPLKRSVVDFIIDRLFAIYDTEGDGFCSVVDIGCGLLLFCGDDKLTRSKLALNLVQTYCPDYAGVVQCISALFKAAVCLDPALELDELRIAAEVQADEEASSYYPQKDDMPPLLGGDLANHMSFLELFSVMLLMCEKGVLDLGLDSSSQQSQSQSQADRVSLSGHSTDKSLGEFADDEEEEDDDDDDDDDDDEGEESAVEEHKLTLRGVSEEDDRFAYAARARCAAGEEGSDGDDDDGGGNDDESGNVYLNDDLFPPSTVVLELRAARAVLGLEEYSAESLMDSLAAHCHAGVISEEGWMAWLTQVTHEAQVAEQDLDIAVYLGNQLFAAFDWEGVGEVEYRDVGAGLSFLCGGSLLEERLMVAFTVMDGDCDGQLERVELVRLIRAALVALSVCSRMAADKILMVGLGSSGSGGWGFYGDSSSSSSGSSSSGRKVGMEAMGDRERLQLLAEAAAKEAISSLNLDPRELLTLELLVETAEDFLKLAAIF